MNAFRILLALMFAYLAIYTAAVIFDHGLNLFPEFFGAMMDMTWAGQFNTDFAGFLILSALWLSWRHHFSAVGLILGICGFFGGIGFLAPYLIVASFQAEGDVVRLLLGDQRAMAQKPDNA